MRRKLSIIKAMHTSGCGVFPHTERSDLYTHIGFKVLFLHLFKSMLIYLIDFQKVCTFFQGIPRNVNQECS